MKRSKRINEPMPSGLVEKVLELTIYPRSFRLAEEVFDSGMELIKQNGLYLPFFRYVAFLECMDTSRGGFISYVRTHSLISDFMRVIILSTDRDNFNVDIKRVVSPNTYMERAGNSVRDGNFSKHFRNPIRIKPYLVTLQKIDSDLTPLEERKEYKLISSSYLA